MRGLHCSAGVNHFLYYQENNISDITGFSAPHVEGIFVQKQFTLYDLTFAFLGNLFIYFFMIPLQNLYSVKKRNAQFLISLLVILLYPHLLSFAITRLFNKLSKYNSTEMFIKILKSISSYVDGCHLSLSQSSIQCTVKPFVLVSLTC